MSTGAEIEKLATCDQLIGVGGADGIVRIIKNCTVIAKWSAHRQQGIITSGPFLFRRGKSWQFLRENGDIYRKTFCGRLISEKFYV